MPSKERKQAVARAKRSEEQADKLDPRDDNNDDDDDEGGGGAQLALNHVPVTRDGKPKDNAQCNFTDGDSRIMVRKGVFVQAYNAQAVVSEDQVIVAHGVTNNGGDAEQLVPMLERVRAVLGELPPQLSADNGYLSEENVAHCERSDVDAYISLRKKEATSTDFPPRTRVGHMQFAMQTKLATKAGKALYALRKVIVEPVFGQIKGAMGFRRFSLRGLRKVPSEWGHRRHVPQHPEAVSAASGPRDGLSTSPTAPPRVTARAARDRWNVSRHAPRRAHGR